MVGEGVDVSEQKHFLQPRWGVGEGDLTYRFEATRPYLEGKDVLDLGGANGHARKDWVHGHISTIAKSVVGVDVDAAGVESARARGYDMVLGDAETIRLDRSFDVVFAGEIIEHLVNFQGLFDTARAHLRPGGHLVLTTPNPFTFTNFVYRIGGVPRVNDDHTCWIDEVTLRQLARKCDFEVLHTAYLPHKSPIAWRARVGNAVRSVLPDQLAWRTLLGVARPV